MPHVVTALRVACGSQGSNTSLVQFETATTNGLAIRSIEVTLTGGAAEDPPFRIRIGAGNTGSGTPDVEVWTSTLNRVNSSLTARAEINSVSVPASNRSVEGYVRPDGGHFFWHIAMTPHGDEWAFGGASPFLGGLVVQTVSNPIAGVTACIVIEAELA